MKKEEIEKQGLRKIHTDLIAIMDAFRDILMVQGEEAIAAALKSIDSNKKNEGAVLNNINSEKIIQALSMSFQLMNLVEENASVQFRRKVENHLGIDAIRGGWGETFKRLLGKGLTEEQIAEVLPNVMVMPELMAHPTEAKRTSVLDLHRDLYLLLVKKENKIWSVSEQEAIDNDIKALLERWWHTREVHLEKPNLESERSNLLYFLSKVFPLALEISDKRLKYTWKAMGFNPKRLSSPNQFPVLKFGSWVGGDRDGHPLITASLTRSTLMAHRKATITILSDALMQLAVRTTFSDGQHVVPKILSDAIQRDISLMDNAGTRTLKRNPGESWRQFIKLIIAKLNNTQEGNFEKIPLANVLNATYNLEMFLSGTALQTSYTTHIRKKRDYPFETVRMMSDFSIQKYQELINRSGFIVFYRQATPIDVLECSRIGSRPAQRTRAKTLKDLRAIPWVFSWNQSRFNLTAWYGVGFALSEQKKNRYSIMSQNSWPIHGHSYATHLFI